MKPELKKRWVDALRSGKYKQIQGGLETAKGFCCLGVACSIFSEELGIRISPPEDRDSEYWEFNGHTDVLPDGLQNYLDVDESGTLSVRIGTWSSLIQLNDDAKYTFDQIADVIDEQF